MSTRSTMPFPAIPSSPRWTGRFRRLVSLAPFVALRVAVILPSAATISIQPVAFINAGGGEYTDVAGNIWEADNLNRYYQWGGTAGNSHIAVVAIANTTDEPLYQTSRVFKRNKPGPYLYKIPVPAVANYTVSLHFSENDILRSQVAKRIFDISFQDGALVQPQFDIVSSAGASFTATTLTVEVAAPDGYVTIDFQNLKFNPCISAIAIYMNLPDGSTMPPTSTPIAPQATLRINAGGETFTDSHGNVWEADNDHAYYSFGGTNGIPSTTAADIVDTVDDRLFQTQRIFKRSRPAPYLYQLPVPAAGVYLIEMYFAEIDPLRSAIGKRKMNIWVQGLLEFQAVDIVDYAGNRTNAPVTLSIYATTIDTSLTIEFEQIKHNPAISAIAVYSTGPIVPTPSSSRPTQEPSEYFSLPPTLAPTVLMSDMSSLIPTAAPTTGVSAWVQMETSNNKLAVRHEACFVMVNDKAYLIGGRRKHPVNIYDPSTRAWAKKSGPGLKIHHMMQCVTADDKIFLLSAWGGNCCSEENLPNIWIYDTSADTWTSRNGLPEDRRRGGGAVILYGRDIYVVGGARGGHVSSAQVVPWFDKYNIDNDQWTVNLTDAPHVRDHTGGAIVTSANGDQLCVAGGRDSSQGFDAVVLPTDCYDFSTGNWSVKPDIPLGRAGAAYGRTCDGQLMVAGGEGFGQAHRQVDVFNGTAWMTVHSLQTARHGTGIAVDCVCQQIHIASGSGGQGGGPELNSTETFFVNGDDTTCI